MRLVNYGIEDGKVRIKLDLVWELEPGIFLGSGEDSCFWYMIYNPSTILDFRVCQYFDDGITLRIVDVPEDISESVEYNKEKRLKKIN